MSDDVLIRRRADGTGYVVPDGSAALDMGWPHTYADGTAIGEVTEGESMPRCLVQASPDELRRLLGLPMMAHIVGAHWDWETDTFEFKVAHPDAPRAVEGETLHRVPLDYFDG